MYLVSLYPIFYWRHKTFMNISSLLTHQSPVCLCLLGDIFFQTSQAFLGSLEDVIVLAHCKAEIILSDVSVGISVEFSGRDSSYANLMDEEPAELEITRTASNMGREGIVSRELYRGHVDKHKVSTLRIRVLEKIDMSARSIYGKVDLIVGDIVIAYRDTQLIKDLAEPLNFTLHICAALVPEALFLCLLESNSSGFLKRRHTAVTDTGVCTGHVLDQVFRADEVPNTPTSGVEGLAGRTNGQSTLVQLWGHSSDSSVWNVEEAVVDFIRQDDKVVLDTQFTNALELLAREDLTDGVVPMNIQLVETLFVSVNQGCLR